MLPPTSTDARADQAAPPAGARCAIHPDRPANGVCTRCGAFACIPCSIVLASGQTVCAACEEKTPSALPWEQRGTIGYPAAIGRTIAGVLLRPYAFFAERPRERALWPTVLLGLGFHLVGQLGQTLTNLAFLEQTRAELAEDPLGRAMPWLASPEFMLGELAVSPLAFLAATFLGAALWSLGLKIVGGLRRPYHVVVRALCYAQAVSLLVPLVAPIGHLGPVGAGFVMAFGIWATVIQIVAVSRMQGIEVGRGVLAFFVWISLAGCVACAVGSALAWSVASQIQLPI